MPPMITKINAILSSIFFNSLFVLLERVQIYYELKQKIYTFGKIFQMPAAFFKASTLSVFSHGTFKSVLPM